MEMIKIEEKEVGKALKELNSFKEGAYIYLNGAITSRVTFYKFYAKIEDEKIKIFDKLKDDIMEIDFSYISNIRKSVDCKKLELTLENDEVITIEI